MSKIRKIGGGELKIKLTRDGNPETTMDVELPSKLDLKGKTTVEFEFTEPVVIRSFITPR